MKAIGVDHCGIADTIGVGTPQRVQAAMERAFEALVKTGVSADDASAKLSFAEFTGIVGLEGKYADAERYKA